MNDRTSAPEPGAVALETGPTPLPRRIGPSDLHVFPLALSGTVFGWTADGPTTTGILDRFAELGGTYLDTADSYAGGRSEIMIGNWMHGRGDRDAFTIATKVGKNPDNPGLSARSIERAVEQSLQRLRVEAIDLLYLHIDDPSVPFDETLLAVDELIRAGKVRYFGGSDHTGNRLIEARIERENGELEPLNNLEITEFALLLGGAGAETVTKLLGNAAVVFAQNPHQWQKLLDDRSKIPLAVEELLRYEAPAQYNVRRAQRDVTLHGVTIAEGSPVFLVGGSANRDPAAWTDADAFEIDRDRIQAQNLGLGYGIHSCLGAALARLESAIALDRMLDLMPRYEVDWAGCKRVNMQNVAGWSNVPVRILR